MMNVHWTEAALTDLEAIEAYIARRSRQYALGVVERIFARSEQLATHPQSGPIVPEYQDNTLRELFENPYRIVYRVLEDRVDVVAIVHSARRMPRVL
jgi:toxin ParE1/3/4